MCLGLLDSLERVLESPDPELKVLRLGDVLSLKAPVLGALEVEALRPAAVLSEGEPAGVPQHQPETQATNWLYACWLQQQQDERVAEDCL